MIAPITAAFNFLLQSKKTKRETKRQLSSQDKKELKKINEMEFFEAVDYLTKRDTGACFEGESKGDGLNNLKRNNIWIIKNGLKCQQYHLFGYF